MVNVTDSGMLCPKCNGGTTVIATNYKISEKVKRRRKCLNCDYRFNTVETIREKDLKAGESIELEERGNERFEELSATERVD